jgi:hypothetical protein
MREEAFASVAAVLSGARRAPVANSAPRGTIGFRAGVMVLTTTPDITITGAGE